MAKYGPDTQASLVELALLDAAASGKLNAVASAIAIGTNINALDHRDLPWNVTPLMHAARNGHVEVVRALLTAGAKVSLKDESPPGEEGGWTALHHAVAFQHVEVARLLLEAGSKVNANPKVVNRLGLYSYDGIARTQLGSQFLPHCSRTGGVFDFGYGLRPNWRRTDATPAMIGSGPGGDFGSIGYEVVISRIGVVKGHVEKLDKADGCIESASGIALTFCE
ncbi:MAG: ankyrin repeat domain-containing protein [Verrucomicrobia bacterium]|nr:ankyrin repeat domain-containing protein [Verrucomicrobiota bacterium]